MTSKKIRAEQEKELKQFRESLKQEMKLLKHEVELMPKDRRKEELKARKERLEQEQQMRVRPRNNNALFFKNSICFVPCNQSLLGAKFLVQVERESRDIPETPE